jgi:hypothetical protein
MSNHIFPEDRTPAAWRKPSAFENGDILARAIGALCISGAASIAFFVILAVRMAVTQ